MREQVKLSNADVRSFNAALPKRQQPDGMQSKVNAELNRQYILLLTRR